MARGWESKEIEMQIESAQERASRAKGLQLSPERIAFERERDGIELSRSRVLGDLATAVNPKYREVLQRSLEFLDEKLSKLNLEKRGQSSGPAVKP